MVSKEIVLSVESYCNEHQVSKQSRLKELNLPTSQYYHSKRKYLEQEMHQLESEGKFLELGSTHQSTFKSKQQKSYPIIKEFEEWIRTNLLLVRKGTPIEKAIRPLAVGVDPREWLSDVLNKSYYYQMNKKDFNELLPHNWKQE